MGEDEQPVDEREKMRFLRRDIDGLKQLAEQLDRALVQDTLEVAEAQRQTEFSIGAVDRALVRMKRLQTGSFNFVFLGTVALLGMLLFFAFLFWK